MKSVPIAPDVPNDHNFRLDVFFYCHDSNVLLVARG